MRNLGTRVTRLKELICERHTPFGACTEIAQRCPHLTQLVLNLKDDTTQETYPLGAALKTTWTRLLKLELDFTASRDGDVLLHFHLPEMLLLQELTLHLGMSYEASEEEEADSVCVHLNGAMPCLQFLDIDSDFDISMYISEAWCPSQLVYCGLFVSLFCNGK